MPSGPRSRFDPHPDGRPSASAGNHPHRRGGPLAQPGLPCRWSPASPWSSAHVCAHPGCDLCSRCGFVHLRADRDELCSSTVVELHYWCRGPGPRWPTRLRWSSIPLGKAAGCLPGALRVGPPHRRGLSVDGLGLTKSCSADTGQRARADSDTIEGRCTMISTRLIGTCRSAGRPMETAGRLRRRTARARTSPSNRSACFT